MACTVVITDGEQRASLAAVRSLGAAGYRCVLTHYAAGSIAAASRYSARNVVVPDALLDPDGFAKAMESVCAQEHASVLLPVTEAALLAILPVRERFHPTLVPFPDAESFVDLNDKKKLLEEAAALGIRVPRQLVVDDASTFHSLDLSDVQFPVVIKPSRSVSIGNGARAKLGVSYARDAADLRSRILALPAAAFPVMLQQRVVGPGTGVFLLIWNGEVRAHFAHRRLWEKPASGGVSVYCESIEADPQLLELSRRLLEQFSWQGVVMVEYKRDRETGDAYLMEANGRFWGSLQLAIAAGVDFPKLLVEAALGLPRRATSEYRIGVRSRWWWGQVDHIVGRVTRRLTAPPVPPGTISVPRAFGHLVLGPLRPDDYEEVLRWSDPGPFLSETLSWISRR